VIIGTTASEFEFMPDGAGGPYSGNQLLGGSELRYTFSVPIAGFSSSVQMSNDTDTRVVAASYVGTSNTSVAAGATEVIPYITVLADTHASYNTSTGEYTVPVSGVYSVNAQVSSNDGGGSVTRIIYVETNTSGSFVSQLFGSSDFGAAGVTNSVKVSGIVRVNAGDKIRVAYGNGYVSGAATISDTRGTCLSIQRLSGPATIAASETVAARYGLNAATNITNGVVINYAQKDYDYTNSVTTGASWRFTAPISGLYEVSVLFYAGPATSGTINQEVGVRLSKNGIAVQYIYIDPAKTTSSVLKVGNGSTRIKLLAGEDIEIIGYNATGITHTAAADPTLNYVEITRIGN
jgi:hypothetical protein